MPANFEDVSAVQSLQRQLAWFRAIAVLALLGVIALAIVWFASTHNNQNGVLHIPGIVVTDAQGHDQILIGASAIATVKSTSAYGSTNSIVFLNRNGAYHLALGQTPAPVVNGKAPVVNGKPVTRIGNGDDYGMALYDTHGSERGGMVFLGGAGRAVIALDRAWPAQDAIGLMVDDKTGFAGIGINYANGNSGFELGTRGDTTSMTLSDPQGRERASLQVKGPVVPVWKFSGAAATSSTGKP